VRWRWATLQVVHCTGSGKTLTMIRALDNFFLDPRPKVAVFPTDAVCKNFYRELGACMSMREHKSACAEWKNSLIITEGVLTEEHKTRMVQQRHVRWPH
jgi:hypothetical protein